MQMGSVAMAAVQDDPVYAAQLAAATVLVALATLMLQVRAPCPPLAYIQSPLTLLTPALHPYTSHFSVEAVVRAAGVSAGARWRVLRGRPCISDRS